jgi:iron complex transport system substrate-binding protein
MRGMQGRNRPTAAEIGRRARRQLRIIFGSRRRAALGAVVIAALLGRAAFGQLALRDDRGVTVKLDRSPRRIVSLLPSLTETVCALGACDRVVGTDRFSNWPDRVASLPKLGGIEDAQIERIVALTPDVVLASTSARVADRLESLGIKVVALESRDRADVRRTLALLGQMLNAQKKAAEVWSDVERQVAAAAARVPASLRGKRVYFEVDATPYAAGPSSFIGETLEALGLGNAVPAELGPFPKLNPEFVVKTQPDVVMAVKASVADMPKRPGWSTLRALRDGRTCAFPSVTYELIVRPGPRMGEAAGAVADCLARLGAGNK